MCLPSAQSCGEQVGGYASQPDQSLGPMQALHRALDHFHELRGLGQCAESLKPCLLGSFGGDDGHTMGQATEDTRASQPQHINPCLGNVLMRSGRAKRACTHRACTARAPRARAAPGIWETAPEPTHDHPPLNTSHARGAKAGKHTSWIQRSHDNAIHVNVVGLGIRSCCRNVDRRGPAPKTGPRLTSRAA